MYPPPTRGFILHASPVQVIEPQSPPTPQHNNQMSSLPPSSQPLSNYGCSTSTSVNNIESKSGKVVVSTRNNDKFEHNNNQNMGHVTQYGGKVGPHVPPRHHIPFADFPQRSQNFEAHPSQTTSLQRQVSSAGAAVPNFYIGSPSSLGGGSLPPTPNAHQPSSSDVRLTRISEETRKLVCAESFVDAAYKYLHVAQEDNKTLQFTR